MEAIKINVNKQADGYNFSISPSIRKLIKSLFPDANPANGIFVSYDLRTDFDRYITQLERFIYPALLGIDKDTDLQPKIDEIHFIDTQTGEILSKLNP
jgi:hypothetical protein